MPKDFSDVLNVFPARIARNPSRWSSRHVLGVYLYANAYEIKKLFVVHDLVRFKLCRVFVRDLREIRLRQETGFLFCRNPDGPASRTMEKRCGHLAVIHELQGPVSEAATSDGLHRIGGAPVHLDEDDDVFPVCSFRVDNADLPQAEHGHADPKHRARTEVAVYSH